MNLILFIQSTRSFLSSRDKNKNQPSFAPPAWLSGHRLRPRYTRSWVRISPGCKVSLGLNTMQYCPLQLWLALCHCVYFSEINIKYVNNFKSKIKAIWKCLRRRWRNIKIKFMLVHLQPPTFLVICRDFASNDSCIHMYVSMYVTKWCSRPLARREQFTTGSRFMVDADHSQLELSRNCLIANLSRWSLPTVTPSSRVWPTCSRLELLLP
jgi:hypothetical protein